MTESRASSGYARATGSARGERRKQDLLEKVTDDLAANGLVDFSLRRAARAAGTTHKVLLYYFDGPEDLLAQGVGRLRERRIDRGLAAAAEPGRSSLAERVRSLWPGLAGAESNVLDQAIGLAVYDPVRHAELARGASERYLPALVSLCPEHWTAQRRSEVAALVLAALRGLLIELRTGGGPDGIEAGLTALDRVLDREEARDRDS